MEAGGGKVQRPWCGRGKGVLEEVQGGCDLEKGGRGGQKELGERVGRALCLRHLQAPLMGGGGGAAELWQEL